ncbi:hypothetical protein KAR91_61800 [Candidatus Pacearchaeota archaeon]|nr:hypothetical protein [Candidatus Pacearchaeota archaeon]
MSEWTKEKKKRLGCLSSKYRFNNLTIIEIGEYNQLKKEEIENMANNCTEEKKTMSEWTDEKKERLLFLQNIEYSILNNSARDELEKLEKEHKEYLDNNCKKKETKTISVMYDEDSNPALALLEKLQKEIDYLQKQLKEWEEDPIDNLGAYHCFAPLKVGENYQVEYNNKYYYIGRREAKTLMDTIAEEEYDYPLAKLNVGDRAVCSDPYNKKRIRKYNTYIPLWLGTEVIIEEKPNKDFPEDAVQIKVKQEWGFGFGAIDYWLLKKKE